MRSAVCLVLAAVITTGCARMNSVYREENLGRSGDSLITDAKQRVVLNLPAETMSPNPDERTAAIRTWEDYGKLQPRRIVCTEPSPDVAEAISSALSTAMSGAWGNTTVSGEAAFAMSSSIAQLGERLASIQLIRDKMFRTCEAYNNGAVSDTTYTLLMSQLDRAMVTLLSAEVAGGAFGRELAAISGGAAADDGPAASAQEIAAQEAVVNQRITELSTAEKAYGDAKLKKDPVATAPELKQLSDAVDSRREALTQARLLLHQMKTGVGARAWGTAATPGGIRGRSDLAAKDPSASVAAIQKEFMTADDASMLLAACITAMDRLRDRSSAIKREVAARGIAVDPEVIREASRESPFELYNTIESLPGASREDKDALKKAAAEEVEGQGQTFGAYCKRSAMPELTRLMKDRTSAAGR